MYVSLKSGPKVDIFVGPAGDQFIGVEGAYINLLKHYSGLAKEKLTAFGVTRFSIPNGSKQAIAWIYRFMLAGEKDPDDVKFDNFDIPHLVLLHSHAAALEYPFLVDKITNQLRYLISQVSLPDVQTVQMISTFVPELNTTIAKNIAFEIVDWVVPWSFEHIQAVYGIEVLEPLIDLAIEDMLKYLIARSEWYYGQPHVQRHLNYINRTYYYRKDPKKVKDLFPEGGSWQVNGQSDVKEPAIKAKTKKTRRNKDKPDQKQESKKTHDGKEDDKHKLKSRDEPAAQTGSPTQEKEAMSSSKSSNSKHKNHKLQKVANGTITESKKPTRQPLNCYTCNETGHISRNCPYVTTVDDLAEPENHQATKPPLNKKTAREPPIYYNCKEVGHIARKCPNQPAQNRGIEFVGANSTANTNGFLNDVTNVRPSAYSGRNKHHRRAKADRSADRVYDPIYISSNGEGLMTCDHEVKTGQATRLGLVI